MVVGTLTERLEGLDVGSLDLGAVSQTLRDVARLEGFVAGLKARLVQRADELAAAGSGVPADELLCRSRKASRRETQRTVDRAKALGELPEMAANLSKGRVGAEHADAIAAAGAGLADETRDELFALDHELTLAAASQTPEQFRRHLRRTIDSLAADERDDRAERQRSSATLTKGVNESTGIYWIRAELAPEAGHRLFRAIDAEVARLKRRPEHEDRRTDQVAADALVELATNGRRAVGAGSAQALVLVDLDTLAHGLHDRAVCELADGSPIPVDTSRRLACDAGIIPIVLNGQGVTLDVGRAERLATPDQRRALRAMYRTCAADGCDRPFDACEIHHLLEWTETRGPTDLGNLLPICSRHHHLAHEGRWRLELDPTTRELSTWLPDGTLHSRCLPDLVAERTAGRAA